MESLEEKLIDAVDNGNLDQVRESLESGSDVHYSSDLALRVACSSGHIEIVKLLLEFGADANSNTSLLNAVYCKNEEIVRLLIRSGADTKIFKKNTHHHLVRNFSVSLIEYLLESGLELTLEMFIEAVRNDKLDVFKLFLHRMPDANISELWMESYMYGSLKIVNYFLDTFDDLDFSNENLVFYACSFGIDTFKKILNRLSDYNSLLIPGCLHSACYNSDFEIVHLLLNLDVNPNITSYRYLDTPLEIAVRKDNNEIFCLLLKYGAVPTINSLINAIANNNVQMSETIVKSNQWSSLEFSIAIEKEIRKGLILHILKLVHEKTGLTLEFEYLGRITNYCLENSKFDIFEYLVDFYGVNVIRPLVQYERCSVDIKNYLLGRYVLIE